MTIISYFLSSLLLFSNMIYSQDTDISNLYNTTVLKNTQTVQQILQAHGFSKVHFTTDDNLKLSGYFLDQSKSKEIKGTIIFSAGFYPGTKEGIATFYAMLADQPYNFLFFDARGHGESEGVLFSYRYLQQYGKQEYEDIIAAIKFIDRYNQQHTICNNILLHGICSGAYHTVKAVNWLEKHNQNLASNVKGIIFDSGWSYIEKIVEPTIAAEIHHRLKNSYFSFLAQPFTSLCHYMYTLFFKASHHAIESIDTSICTICCPILFIHSLHDQYISIDQVRPLVEKTKCAKTWFPDIDAHATNHLKKQHKYKEELESFLTSL